VCACTTYYCCNMAFETVQSATGYRYIVGDQAFVRYSTRKGVKYLKCVFEDCTARAKIKNDQLTLRKQHTDHESATSYINQMRIRAECRKRAADNDTTTLRQLCVCHTNIAFLKFTYNWNWLLLTVAIICASQFLFDVSITRHFQSMVITRRFYYLTFPCCGHYSTFQLLGLSKPCPNDSTFLLLGISRLPSTSTHRISRILYVALCRCFALAFLR